MSKAGYGSISDMLNIRLFSLCFRAWRELGIPLDRSWEVLGVPRASWRGKKGGCGGSLSVRSHQRLLGPRRHPMKFIQISKFKRVHDILNNGANPRVSPVDPQTE